MLPSDVKGRRVLISPLNWGMGHVARCIPLIHQFISTGNTVFVAANAYQTSIFRAYFPRIQYIEHSGYPFGFGGRGKFEFDLLMQWNKLRDRLKFELNEVNYLVDIHKIDLVISDHRYGFRSEKCMSICLTHQLNLPVRWYEGWVQKMHYHYLRKFDEIWVPDNEDSEYAGELSRNKANLIVTSIGPLSRFTLYDKVEKDLEELVIVSGPTVYAKQFLDEVLIQTKKTEKVPVVICPEELILMKGTTGCSMISSKNWPNADAFILRAKKIISRSGYSTIMDLIELGVPFDISATPGQREQEYLKQLWDNKQKTK
ncbi:MAG: hypothetical protein ACK45H_10230 [Bacteroidota bacterium]